MTAFPGWRRVPHPARLLQHRFLREAAFPRKFPSPSPSSSPHRRILRTARAFVLAPLNPLGQRAVRNHGGVRNRGRVRSHCDRPRAWPWPGAPRSGNVVDRSSACAPTVRRDISPVRRRAPNEKSPGLLCGDLGLQLIEAIDQREDVRDDCCLDRASCPGFTRGAGGYVDPAPAPHLRLQALRERDAHL